MIIADPSRLRLLMTLDPTIAALITLSRLSIEPFDVANLSRRLVELAFEHLPVDGVGVMIAQPDGLAFLSADRAEVSRVEQMQALTQSGPGPDAVIGLRTVVSGDLNEEVAADWAAYVGVAREAGLRSVVAVPLVSRGRGWGVLDLYRQGPGRWSDQEVATAELLASVAVSYLVMAADHDDGLVAQRELAYRSAHDELTGLPNRAVLFDRLSHALIGAARRGRALAVFVIGLDRFKYINDSFGYTIGDTVLIQAAERMSGALRAGDTLARLAGDEFVVVCENLPQQSGPELENQISVVVRRFRDALADPMQIPDVDLTVTVSIGVATSDSRSTADDLVSDAAAAMYRAKQPRHAELRIRALGSAGVRRGGRELERQLFQALQRKQLKVHYQPIVSATNHSVRAAEALLRWAHPEHGLLPATEFIGIAESTGLIVPFGHWVIEQVCAQMQQWQQQHTPHAPATTYVNLSAAEMTDPRLGGLMSAALTRHHLQPQHIGLEIVEASFIDFDTVATLADYQRRGHPLSVDDFGTGFSSLSRLIELPVGLAKIDRSLTAHVADDLRRRTLVDAVVAFAEKIDLTVVGEGVETPDQAEQLTAAGCDLLQGFLFGKPDSPAMFATAKAERQ